MLCTARLANVPCIGIPPTAIVGGRLARVGSLTFVVAGLDPAIHDAVHQRSLARRARAAEGGGEDTDREGEGSEGSKYS